MIVGFYGPPCSGKSTLAHALFSALKEKGHNAEFICEYARSYIIKNKQKILTEGLSDEDQQSILTGQKEEEEIFEKNCDIVVTDTCTANTCFYSKKLGSDSNILRNAERYDVLFVTYFDETSFIKIKDSNRVHDICQCRDLNIKMFDAINKIDDSARQGKIYYLSGQMEGRVLSAISYVEERIRANSHIKKSN